MSRIKTRLGRSIEDKLEELRREMRWVRQLYKHRRPLGTISTIARLGTLWDYAPDGDPPRLYLEYVGKARNAADAKPDLIKIMRALKCIFGDPRVYGGGDSAPRACYEATGSLREFKVTVQLEVPWLPKGCEVRTERHRTWGTRVHHSVSCRR